MAASQQALDEAYDPFSDAHGSDPQAFFRRARAEAPVFYSSSLKVWVVSRHEDVMAVLKDHRRFAISIEMGRVDHYTPEARAILAANPIAADSLVQVDQPEHTRLRSSITRALSAQRIARLEPRVRTLSSRLVDEFAELGRVDIVERYARRFPVIVIGSLLDMPEADFPRIQELSQERLELLAGDVPPDAQPPLARSTVALAQYVYDLAARRRQAPGDDLASELIETSEAGQKPLTQGEVAAMLRLLLVGGFETTIKLLGNCLIHLLSDRRRWMAVRDDRSRIPAVVEEALRVDGPVVSTLRTAREAVEVGGARIPAGAMVQVLTSSANHDETVFADPDVYDPDRERPAAHMAFGYGIHFCVGAPLARLEMRIALEQLTERFPTLRLVPGARVQYETNMLLRGPKELLVEWDTSP